MEESYVCWLSVIRRETGGPGYAVFRMFVWTGICSRFSMEMSLIRALFCVCNTGQFTSGLRKASLAFACFNVIFFDRRRPPI